MFLCVDSVFIVVHSPMCVCVLSCSCVCHFVAVFRKPLRQFYEITFYEKNSVGTPPLEIRFSDRNGPLMRSYEFGQYIPYFQIFIIGFKLYKKPHHLKRGRIFNHTPFLGVPRSSGNFVGVGTLFDHMRFWTTIAAKEPN